MVELKRLHVIQQISCLTQDHLRNYLIFVYLRIIDGLSGWILDITFQKCRYVIQFGEIKLGISTSLSKSE